MVRLWRGVLSWALNENGLDFPQTFRILGLKHLASPMNDRKRIAAVLRDYLARERISREQFAFKARLGKSTVDKLLTGLYSDRTLSIVESHTGLTLRALSPDGPTDIRTATRVAPQVERQPPTGPSIAVLPFRNSNGDPSRDFFSDGLSEDIIAALARLRWLFVIARNSSFIYKGRMVDVREVARELGVRYVLEGSVRTAAQRIRITGQLSDAETGKHIWAEKYDRDLQDIFQIQDEITERVVAAVEPHLYAEEGYRAESLPPGSIDAWGLVVRGMGLINRIGRTQNEQAQELLRQAVVLDPNYAKAHALLGWAVRWSTHCSWHPNPQEGYRQAAAHAQDALRLDPAEAVGSHGAGPLLQQCWGSRACFRRTRCCYQLQSQFRPRPYSAGLGSPARRMDGRSHIRDGVGPAIKSSRQFFRPLYLDSCSRAALSAAVRGGATVPADLGRCL